MRGGIVLFVSVAVSTGLGLVSACASFDEGSSSAIDGGGVSTDGSAADAATGAADGFAEAAPTDGNPCSSRAAKFGGTQYFQVGAPASGFDPPTMTIEAWIYVPSSAPKSDVHIVSHIEAGDTAGWDLGLTTERNLVFHAYTPSGTPSTFGGSAQAAVPTDRWVHVAFTRDPVKAESRLWVDANPNGPLSKDLPFGGVTTRNLRIGVDSTGGDHGYVGLIEEVRISTVVRSISAARKSAEPDPDTVGLWRFEEPDGDAVDVSPNAKKATINGPVPRICMPSFADDAVIP